MYDLDFQSRDDVQSQTAETLEGATNILLRREEPRGPYQPHLSTDDRTSSTASFGHRRRLGLAPWHRRNSHDSVWSVTSSIRDVLRGNTPCATPKSAMGYGDHKGKKFATGMLNLRLDLAVPRLCCSYKPRSTDFL
jgi:parafibromin